MLDVRSTMMQSMLQRNELSATCVNIEKTTCQLDDQERNKRKRTRDERLRVPDGQELEAHPGDRSEASLLLCREGKERVGDRCAGVHVGRPLGIIGCRSTPRKESV
jgi:hypothetical protein